MNLPTIEKDKEDYYQQFFEDEISQPLVKMSPTAMIAESQENSFNKFSAQQADAVLNRKFHSKLRGIKPVRND